MRRFVSLLACLVLPGFLSGCMGADAGRAESLIQQAEQAQRNVRSEGLVVRFTIDAEGHSGGMAMQGGAYLKGPRAGDFYLTGTPTGELGTSGMPGSFGVLRRGGMVTLRLAGRTETMPVSAARSTLGSDLGDVTKFLDLARYVKSVSVDETDLGGRPADRIVGHLDTKAMLGGVGGLGAQALGALNVHFGDIRAVLFVPRDTHLVEVMFADMDIEVAGHKAHMHLSVAVNDVNKPVAFPAF